MQLPPEIREVLAEEAAALVASLPESNRRARFETLRADISSGEVPVDSDDDLAALLELTLGTGRARKVHGALAETTLVRLYNRTCAGRAAAESVNEVNEALRALAGHTIASIAFSAAGPGAFRLAIGTDRCRIAVETDRTGIRVKDVQVGL